ncbi:hypothetical protein BYT27DRAFT_7217717 [Phlegmacium glaucopus]|nr:hypothetical protein BYT27DRAFT_7217717 [Phlegmacium glaucopus]
MDRIIGSLKLRGLREGIRNNVVLLLVTLKYYTASSDFERFETPGIRRVASEDPPFLERKAPKLSEEFPEGSKIFFLGEHAYGVPAQVSTNTGNNFIILAAEIDKFKNVVHRKASRYYPSFKAAEIVGISGRALEKVTSSFMVITSDNQKNNLGRSLKYEAKALKVIDYSRKGSEKAIELLREYKSKFPTDFRCLDGNGDGMIKAADFEAVSLYCDQLTKETVAEIEALADTVTKSKSPGSIEKAIVKSIPRQAVLEPSHVAYRLQIQHFALGDSTYLSKEWYQSV